MPRSKSDIANSAIRIFLHDMGVAYDVERNLEPYKKRKHFAKVIEFFDNRCCYCAAEFSPDRRPVEDHLIPTNRTSLGLHAWGNIVPACNACNALKQGKEWKEFVITRAGPDAKERFTRVSSFVELHQYRPKDDLSVAAAELYEEVGEVSMKLIQIKINRLRAEI